MDLVEIYFNPFNLTANCGPPLPARNGHLLPYNSTLEGAEVVYVCWNVYQEKNTSQCTEIYTTAVCNEEGIWEPKFDDTCSIFSGKLSPAVLLVSRPFPAFQSFHINWEEPGDDAVMWSPSV